MRAVSCGRVKWAAVRCQPARCAGAARPEGREPWGQGRVLSGGSRRARRRAARQEGARAGQAVAASHGSGGVCAPHFRGVKRGAGRHRAPRARCRRLSRRRGAAVARAARGGGGGGLANGSSNVRVLALRWRPLGRRRGGRQEGRLAGPGWRPGSAPQAGGAPAPRHLGCEVCWVVADGAGQKAMRAARARSTTHSASACLVARQGARKPCKRPGRGQRVRGSAAAGQ
jgi:hypothetical protein